MNNNDTVHCRFLTNVDCCARFMSNLSSTGLQPQVGDRIVVFSERMKELEMEVCRRTWARHSNQQDWILECELKLTFPWAGIPGGMNKLQEWIQK